ncbi:MAG: glucosyl-3-phosphoglycerate synthase [Acidimicrobiia bacterium]
MASPALGRTPMFSHRQFAARRLAAAKDELGLTASLCIPARNEEATIGVIVESARRHLVEKVPLLDEILVLDDGSTDATVAAARAAGARVVSGAGVLPEAGPGSGKGNAIWKSLAASRGDLVCWVDGDISDFGPRFVVGLLGPLLTHPEVAFVKGFYHRPGGGAAGGGRVTELAARPILSLLFPALAAVVQPLAGEYAGRRPLLESLPITQGWGVDLALVLDVAATAGLPALAQVDLGTRRHRHRPLDELAPQAMAVLLTALRRAGLEPRPGVGLGPHALEEPGVGPTTRSRGRSKEENADGGGGAAKPPETVLVRFDETHGRLEVPVEASERPPLASPPGPADELSA